MRPSSSRFLLLLPGLLALLLYLPAIAHGYVWDDTYFLRDMPYLRDPALWWKALSEPLFVSHNYFRPLPLLMFVAESHFQSAVIFHCVNILLHVVNTTLVTSLACTLLPNDRQGRWLAALAGFAFALHPALVENVCWISDRFDLLMTSFILLALWLETRAFAMRDALIALCLLGALLSKEVGVVLLLLLPAWQFVRAGTAWRTVLRARWRLYLCMVFALGIYFALRVSAFGFLFRSDTQMHPGNALQHLLLIGKTVGWYCTLLLFPFGRMSPVHPGATPVMANDIGAWLGLLLTVAALACAWRWRGTRASWLLLMLLVVLAPVSNLLPLTIGDNMVHDRYLILPVAFSALLLAHALGVATAGRAAWYTRVVGAWIMAAAVGVMLIVPHWESEATLWTWAYEKHPESQIAAANYLAVLVNAQRNDEALAMCDRLMAWDKYQGGALEMRALLLFRMNRLDAAEAAARAALALPTDGSAMGRLIGSDHLNILAQIHMDQGRWADAERELRESLALTPYYARSHYILALWYYRRGRTQEGDAAMAVMRRYALPEYATAYTEAAQGVRDLSVSGKISGRSS